ncbi:helix-turn-helix domain-containing protein [Arsukibacterium indicum]|uniref:AraC family transcriptional regulator n=1 Tax=Arsukibacterium indicum TaxID=2848612 RepID=A0ABS6ML78_9GAMM|nr:AraC family transcriptional regulator [Arsukibacterium indicum]MBV2129330.1 AraC family transcriptional regulator [Arsukibacterium indicum]
MTIASHGFWRYRATASNCSNWHNSPLPLLKQHICRQLPQVPRLNDMARLLNISSRSLQRYLQASNTCFRQVVNECRHQLAQQYLQENTYNIQEIATQLGFEEQSSFQKAFKSWQGCPPGVYRQRSNSKNSRSFPGQPLASRQVMYGTN